MPAHLHKAPEFRRKRERLCPHCGCWLSYALSIVATALLSLCLTWFPLYFPWTSQKQLRRTRYLVLGKKTRSHHQQHVRAQCVCECMDGPSNTDRPVLHSVCVCVCVCARNIMNRAIKSSGHHTGWHLLWKSLCYRQCPLCPTSAGC